jgi:thioesterase domain-containing protein
MVTRGRRTVGNLPNGAPAPPLDESAREALCRDLERRWHAEIPISAAMGIRVVAFDGEMLVIRAPLDPNVNVHGSGFAGSQFALASLCGWGLLHLQLALHDLQASILFVDGHIDCRRPVRAGMLASCRMTSEVSTAMADLHGRGKSRCRLATRVESEGKLAAEFLGTYGLKR